MLLPTIVKSKIFHGNLHQMKPDLPSVQLSKLEELVNSNHSYTMSRNKNSIELHFTPDFPEAIPHKPNGEEVEHVMYGTLIAHEVFFFRFVTRSSFGETSTDLHGHDDPVMLWLSFL